ncbi:serine dehydratase subunit alpha family protein [Treponema sp. Marseille-Q4130]|uniref:L-cysteine desulfidase family protein n=1 Tax=Treponema sp. Marseille-Q4130 TaxID=2766702 RepID=UPI00165236DE|nr:L-serine ammonia-lyase, iron-sulfur-dependent, subunit alpha [Treponema sp. Marseille-Q4130]MBC6719671.1 serine dehydratase subunit alpha family protein [Treponema sp. Marseille-Q4130]
MDKKVYDAYVAILKTELVPALGCTEPIAIAFAAAKARDVLGSFPETIRVEASGNIVKNVQGVTVPNSGGLKGIDVAATLGAVGGDAEIGLEVLSKITEEQIKKTKELVDSGFCTCSLVDGKDNLYIRVTAKRGEDTAVVVVSEKHTNIAYVEKNGKVLIDVKSTGVKNDAGNEANKSLLSVRDIIRFADEVNIDDVRAVIERQIEYNTAISKEGLAREYGAKVGRTLEKLYDKNDVRVRARAAAAAGSDARMSGCPLPVVINSGSGNQGMTVSLPVIEYAKEWNVPHDKLIRALVLANLIALLQKRYIGSLSAFCGAVCAATGAGCGITYLHGGDEDAVARTITNTLADVGGIVCDGAKPSCAAKIASAVDAAILGFELGSHEGVAFKSGEGLVKESAEDTIRSFGRMGREGMRSTDTEILHIMLEK